MIDIDQETAVAEAAGGLALGAAVLPSQLFPVFPQILVELGMGDDVGLVLGSL